MNRSESLKIFTDSKIALVELRHLKKITAKEVSSGALRKHLTQIFNLPRWNALLDGYGKI